MMPPIQLCNLLTPPAHLLQVLPPHIALCRVRARPPRPAPEALVPARRADEVDDERQHDEPCGDGDELERVEPALRGGQAEDDGRDAHAEEGAGRFGEPGGREGFVVVG